MNNTVTIKVWGDFACFTRPEMKVERVSYDVPTPSAVRGIFEAILWKPAIRWIITQIDVLNPIQWTSVRRNELGGKIPLSNITSTMKQGKGLLGTYIEEDRQQRAGLILRDVAYQIHAHFEMTEKAGPTDNPQKFYEMFVRRAEKGQCFNQPYLGTREFSAHFELITTPEQSVAETRDLGWMLYDIDFANPADPKPKFFRGQLVSGRIKVPHPDSNEVRG